ncbi:FAD-dependent oxidoreductase [Gorillibacterium sp. CAU 1737]|uniref:FAD-dependent oxidoreductase n=1 Tax=Gorillibacterium sp. CAU 1737 TaxID=3140362 RepID=UPI0032607B16
MSLSPFPQSYWLASAEVPQFPKLTETLETEIVVIGGGIAGITTAYLLAKAGKEVVLVTSGRLLGGTTGHTTAKLTAQHDLIYDEYMQHFGREKAGLYYRANQEAIAFVRKVVEEAGISCDLVEEDAYVYATTEEGEQQVRKEFAAYQELGIPGELVTEMPLPVSARCALKMPGQARFHPVPYLVYLVKEFVNRGGRVFEHTEVEKVKEEEPMRAILAPGLEIICRDLVSCSHYPVYESGFFFARVHPESSYILAARAPGSLIPGMYISADKPTRSVRSLSYGEDRLLLIAGESHHTGEGGCTIRHYQALEKWARDQLGVSEFPYRWSTHDYVTTDKLPYIGRVSSKRTHSYVATGFRKWGMTTGTISALLFRDLLTGQATPYEELYSPSRFHLDPDVPGLASNVGTVAQHFAGAKLEWHWRKLDDLAPGDGAILRVDGRRTAAFRDPQGELHLLDATCTHMGCEVEWNEGDRTWDCPCHGSRFTYTGKVVTGPATLPLPKVER